MTTEVLEGVIGEIKKVEAYRISVGLPPLNILDIKDACELQYEKAFVVVASTKDGRPVTSCYMVWRFEGNADGQPGEWQHNGGMRWVFDDEDA